MTLTLHLSPELEKRLAEAAERHGCAVDAYTVQLLDQSLPPKDASKELPRAIQSWIDEGDPKVRVSVIVITRFGIMIGCFGMVITWARERVPGSRFLVVVASR